MNRIYRWIGFGYRLARLKFGLKVNMGILACGFVSGKNIPSAITFCSSAKKEHVYFLMSGITFSGVENWGVEGNISILFKECKFENCIPVEGDHLYIWGGK